MFLSNYLFPPKFNSLERNCTWKDRLIKILQSYDYIKAFFFWLVMHPNIWVHSWKRYILWQKNKLINFSRKKSHFLSISSDMPKIVTLILFSQMNCMNYIWKLYFISRLQWNLRYIYLYSVKGKTPANWEKKWFRCQYALDPFLLAIRSKHLQCFDFCRSYASWKFVGAGRGLVLL